MPIVVAFMVVASLISGNLHSPLWHSDAILGRGDHPISYTGAYNGTFINSNRESSNPLSDADNPLEHQEGRDALISAKLALAPSSVMVMVKQVAHGLGINPEGE